MKMTPYYPQGDELSVWLSFEQIEEFKAQCLKTFADFWSVVLPFEDGRYAHLSVDQRNQIMTAYEKGEDVQKLVQSFGLMIVKSRPDLIEFKKQLAVVREKTAEQIRLIQLVVKLIHATDKIPEIKILYQDEKIVVVDKQAGLLVHPFKKHTHDRYTLMSLTRNKLGQFVYPVHRLDRPVSGVVLMTLNSDWVKPIQEMWHDDETLKEYLALVRGDLEDAGVIDFPLSDENGIKKDSFTQFWVLERFADLALVKVHISTGRKHQIRRHFSRRVTPVVGDTAHGKGDVNFFFREHFGFDRLFLHHHKLTLKNPFGEGKLEFVSPIPDELEAILERLRQGEVIFKRVRKAPEEDQGQE